MPPLPEELEGNSPSEELQRSNAGGDEVAHEDQEQAKFRDEAQRGIDAIPTTGGSNLPGGLSRDAAASKRGSGAKKDGEEPFGDKSSGKPSFGRNITNRVLGSVSKNRRAKLIGAAIATSLLLGVVGFIAALPYELVHIEENITHAFDKRLEHSIQQRLASHYKKIFAEGSKTGGDQNTGDPIADADHNFSLDQFATDAGFSGQIENSSGEVVALTDSNGDKFNVNDSTLEDPSSPLMEKIDNRFPTLDFFRESIRSFNLDAAFGLTRSFLSGKDEPVSDDQATLDKQVDDAFTATEANTNGAPDANAGNEEDAKDDINESTSDAQTESSLSFGAANTALTLCGAVGISESIHRSLWLLRVVQLMRISNSVILDSGHQLKTGNLHASQLESLMKLLSGFAKSGGWQVISGSKGAKVSDVEKGKFAANPSGTLANVTGAVDNPGTTTVCNPVNTAIKDTPLGLGPIIASGGLDAAENILGPEESGITDVLTTIVVGVTKNFAIGDALNYLAGIATDAASKPIIDVANATGGDIVDATISGYDNYSNMNEMSNGGERLSPAQVADLNQAADTQEAQVAQQKGLAYQIFSPSYSNSLVSILMDKAPMAPGQVAGGVNTMVAMISEPFSPKLMHSFGSFLVSTTPTASADDPASDAEDPTGWGVQQYGIPDSLLAEYPDPEANEQAVITYLCSQPGEDGDQPGLYDGDCASPPTGSSSSELTDQNDAHYDPYHDYVAECFTNHDPNAVAADPKCDPSNSGPNGIYDRFRVYRFDLGIANMLTSYNNSNDDQNPNGSNATPTPTAPTTPVTGTIVTGTCATLKDQILNNPNMEFGNYGSASSQKSDIENCKLVDNLYELIASLLNAGYKIPVNALRSDHSVDGDTDGLHNPCGCAIDIGYAGTDPAGVQLYNYVYQNREALHINMMIHQPPPPGTQCVGNGDPVDCLSFFGQTTYDEHANHIHLGVWKTGH